MGKFSKRTQAYLYLLINVLCWGAALPIVKLGLPYTTPFRYLLYRYLFACIFSLPLLYLLYKDTWRRYVCCIPTIVRLELVGTLISLAILYVGLEKTTVIETGLITMTLPIFIAVAGISVLQEKEEKHEWVGLGIAVIGTCALTILPALLNGGFSFRSLTGNALILLYNVLTAWYFIAIKKAYRKIPKLFVSIVSFFVGLVGFFALSMVEASTTLPQFFSMVQLDFTHKEVWGIALYMATFGSIIGLTAYIKGQDLIEASEAGIFSYLQPLVYIPLSIVLLREHVSLYQGIPLLIIFLGVYIAQRKLKSG